MDIVGQKELKIFFVHSNMPAFAKTDFDILSEVYNVHSFDFPSLQKDVIGVIKCLPALWKAVMWADITFSWFGKLHAFFTVLFSKLLGKKSVVIAGGDDVAYVPEVNYGMFSFWWKKWCPLFVFRYADLVLPVSKYNKNETIVNAKADSRKVRMIYHGFSSEIFKKNPSIEKENLVITIGSISKETKMIKGLKLFVDSAKLLPDVNFLLIGPDKDGAGAGLEKNSSRNVEFLGGAYGQDLTDLCSRAKVYVQVSIHESFGCSLAEAMLCECIPVVSRNGAIPEVVGDCGIYVDELSPEKVAEKIKYALTLPDDFGLKAKNRISLAFPLEKRKKELLNVIEEIA